MPKVDLTPDELNLATLALLWFEKSDDLLGDFSDAGKAREASYDLRAKLRQHREGYVP